MAFRNLRILLGLVFENSSGRDWAWKYVFRVGAKSLQLMRMCSIVRGAKQGIHSGGSFPLRRCSCVSLEWPMRSRESMDLSFFERGDRGICCLIETVGHILWSLLGM